MAVVGGLGFSGSQKSCRASADGLQQGLALARQAGLQLGEVGQALGAEQFGEQGGAGGIQGAQLAQVEADVGRHFAAQARHLALQSRVVGERPITYGSDAGGLGGAIQAHVAGLRLCRHGAEAYTGFSVPE